MMLPSIETRISSFFLLSHLQSKSRFLIKKLKFFPVNKYYLKLAFLASFQEPSSVHRETRWVFLMKNVSKYLVKLGIMKAF